MIGDVTTAVKLLKSALPMARTRDDVQDLNQVSVLFLVLPRAGAVMTVLSAYS
jgi:hypothetical protein